MTFHRGSAIRPRRGRAVPFSSFAIGHFKAKTVSLVHPENWHSSGIDNLEPDAWRALRQPGCACVVAGPGAGKTEFLAQRAVYLLESGICPPSRRVLAISFKSDAADNPATRVRQRCLPKIAARLVSPTFDAFAKSMVDRFHSAISANWRPTRPYDIAYPTRRQVEGFLNLNRLGAPPVWQADIAGLGVDDFESHHVGVHRLPLVQAEPETGLDFTINRWWAGQLRDRQRSKLTFVSLNWLAELLLRANPHVSRALRATYPFVFVDEFQDTTYAHYDFLLSAFADPRIAITAVGDDKQRIMVWAGAHRRLSAFRG